MQADLRHKAWDRSRELKQRRASNPDRRRPMLEPDRVGGQPQRKQWPLWLVRAVAVTWGALAVVVTPLASESALVLAAPAADRSLIPWLLYLSLSSVPYVMLVACVGGLASSLGANALKRVRLSCAFVMLPLFSLSLVLIAFFLADTVCAGHGACPS